MRLIDADAFERKVMCGDEEDIQDVIYSLRDFPTAYDIDKVVEQLEKNGRKMSEAKSNKPFGKASPACHNYYKAISVRRAIEIVKGGGVNG